MIGTVTPSCSYQRFDGRILPKRGCAIFTSLILTSIRGGLAKHSGALCLANTLQESETLCRHPLESLIRSEGHYGAVEIAVMQGRTDQSPPL